MKNDGLKNGLLYSVSIVAAALGVSTYLHNNFAKKGWVLARFQKIETKTSFLDEAKEKDRLTIQARIHKLELQINALRNEIKSLTRELRDRN